VALARSFCWAGWRARLTVVKTISRAGDGRVLRDQVQRQV
jgi:hypothetical protein